ncbi:MAG: hypothetical protein DHS20C15_23010 [Planctomycetota bacterium]|nr:MAG: hypothetical protein DHS20C15_23010 [Planctomycetota bacterium]
MTRSERAAAVAGLRLGLVCLALLVLLGYWAFSDDSLPRADRRLRLTPANYVGRFEPVPLAGEERMTWNLHSGDELRFSVRVPGDNAVLRLNQAYLAGRPQLAVRIVRGDGRTQELAVLPGSDERWKQERVPLPVDAGEQIEVELAALGTAARPTMGGLLIADVVLESEGRGRRPEERPLAVRHLAADLLAQRALDRVAAPSSVTSARVGLPGPACLELVSGQSADFVLEEIGVDAQLEVVVRVHPQAPANVLAPARLLIRVGDELISNTSLREVAQPGPEGDPAYETLIRASLTNFEGRPLELEFVLEGGENMFVGLREVMITEPQVAPRRAPDPAESKRVVLVLIDGLRSDRLGALGYEHGHTPNLDELAQLGTLWSKVMLPSSWSTPNVATLLTGRSPLVHGVGMASGRKLSPRLPTLAHWASWAGVSTAAFGSTSVIGPSTGLHRGFDHSLRRAVPAPVLVEYAVDWLYEVAPFDSFLVMHFGDLLPPHQSEPQDQAAVRTTPDPELVDFLRPMDPRPGVAESMAMELGPYYDAELARVDRAIGDLVRGIQELDQWSSTLFVVVGTHGQEFFEHGGRGAGQSLFDEVVTTPALLVAPGLPALSRPVHEAITLADLSVLIGQRSGLASADALPGREPPPYGPDGSDRRLHAVLMPHTGVTTRRLEASRRGDMLYLSDPVLDLRGLFDLSVDPLARQNLLEGDDDLVLRTEAESLAESFENWYRDELTESAAWPVQR